MRERRRKDWVAFLQGFQLRLQQSAQNQKTPGNRAGGLTPSPLGGGGAPRGHQPLSEAGCASLGAQGRRCHRHNFPYWVGLARTCAGRSLAFVSILRRPRLYRRPPGAGPAQPSQPGFGGVTCVACPLLASEWRPCGRDQRRARELHSHRPHQRGAPPPRSGLCRRPGLSWP
jgi:hypothetical protein